MEARIISCLICPATFDSVDVLRTHLLRDHGNGVSGETNEIGSRSEAASIEDIPALHVGLKHEASFEKSTLVHDEISGLPAQTKEISQQQNECPLESNDPGQFAKQCFKEQLLDLSYIEVKQVVQDYENRATTGLEEGASSTLTVEYLGSSLCFQQKDNTNGTKAPEELFHKNSGSITDGRRVFKEECPDADGSSIGLPDDYERTRKKKKNKKGSCIHLDIHVYKMPLCEECGISFRRKELLQAHLDGHNGGMKTIAETYTDPEEMESVGQTDLSMRGGAESIHVSNGDTKIEHTSYTTHDPKFKKRIELQPTGNVIDSDSGTIPQCMEQMKESLIPGPKIEKGSKRRLECSVCSKHFLHNYQLKEHMISHTKIYPFKCDVCERKFRRNSELRQHSCRGERRFGCSECSKHFVQKWHLKEHMITHTKVYPFKCDVCEKKFRRNSELRQHKCRTENQATNILEQRYLKKKQKLESKMQKRSQLEFGCSVCSKHFRHNYKLKEHMISHTKIYPFKCDVCERKFRRNSELRQHSCGERRFGCSECSKRFVQKWHLKEHMITHTKVYPFKCDVCEKKFRRNSELRQHKCQTKEQAENILKIRSLEKKIKLKIHRSSLPRKFECSECGKCFHHKWNLKQHMKTHTKVHPFRCDVCERNFSRNSELRQHNCLGQCVQKDKLVVTNNSEEMQTKMDGHFEVPTCIPKMKKGLERRFKCSECSKCFIQSNHRKEHMITHTKIYPFKCDVCEKKFRRNSELMQHNCLGQCVQKDKIVVTNNSEEMQTKMDGNFETPENQTELSETISCNTTLPQCTEQIKDSSETETLTSIPKMKKGSERRFKCSECSKHFIQKGHLKEHMITHTRVYPFKCDVCERNFKRNSELRQHKCRGQCVQKDKLVVTNNSEEMQTNMDGHSEVLENKNELSETNSCNTTLPQCTEQKSSSETETLTSIPKMKKGSERRFKCSECSKCFIQSNHRKEHMITHTKIYPFKCDVCEKKFRRNSELMQHNCLGQCVQKDKIVVTNNSEEMQTKMDGNFETPENQTELSETISCNTTLPQCTEQIKDSSETETLTSIPKMKKGSERRFKCSECSKHFIQKGHLKEHMITHTRVYPFKCDVCERNFKRNSELRQHKCRGQCVQKDKLVVTNNSEEMQTNMDGHSEVLENKNELSETNSCNTILPQCTEQKSSSETETLTSIPKMKKGSERRFKCSECSKCFIQSNHRKEHMITHTKIYPFKCDVCEKKFRKNSELMQHNCLGQCVQKDKIVVTNNSEEMQTKMDGNFETPENQTELSETSSCNTTLPQCTEQIKDVCEKKFRRNSELKQHNCLTQGVQTYGTFKTPEMGIQLSETDSYSRTERVSENKKILGVTNESKDLEKEVKKSLNEVDLPIKSDIGNTNSRRKSEFVTCDICNKDVRRRWASHHWAIHNKKYACEICGKRYVIPYDLKTHMMKHTGERPFPCPYCGKRFTTQGTLNIHLKSHSSAKPFKCNTCSKAFKRKDALDKHHVQNHTSERNILCHVCGTAFFLRSSLHVHMLIHETVRKHVCLICGKAFRTLCKLNKHKFIHSAEKNIKCQSCDYRCIDHAYLKSHMLSKHSDDRPYKCDVCEQTFKKSENKTAHMRIHSGSKPYQCDACDAAFTHYAGLYLHKKRHSHMTH